MIPFLDLKAAYDALGNELDAAVSRAARSGWYIGGSEVEAFEQAFAAYTQSRHCVGVGNGLDALTLALRALGIGVGDEVIVPSNTFIATWLAVSAVGATLVPVEPPAGHSVIDAQGIEAKITARTKAIMPVHLYGTPADMPAICALARQHQLYVVEDAAQAHGAEVHGQRIGAHGDVVAWSFYPGKNLGALGDGGAVTTNDAGLADRIRRLGNYGSSVKYHNEVQGVNSRLDPIQAAVLAVKLAHLDAWNQHRRKIAQRYLDGLSGLPLRLPQVPDWAMPVWHLFVVATPQRDTLQHALQAAGIQTLIHYPVPPHRQPAYREYAHLHLPQAESDAGQVLSLPIGPQLTLSDVDRVINAIRQFYKG